MTRWDGPDGYWVSDDTALVDVDLVHRWLSTESYWALARSRDTVARSIASSLNLGLYSPYGAQAGFCRWVTDGATFAWLCDVFVLDEHRGHGLGVFLVHTAAAHPAVQGIRRLLGTRDAHGLYEKFGFAVVPSPERLMEIRPEGTPT